MNAASSKIKSDNASERPADSFEAISLIWLPFLNISDNLLFYTMAVFNHCGKPSYITRTFVTKFLAVSFEVAIHKIFLSA